MFEQFACCINSDSRGTGLKGCQDQTGHEWAHAEIPGIDMCKEADRYLHYMYDCVFHFCSPKITSVVLYWYIFVGTRGSNQ